MTGRRPPVRPPQAKILAALGISWLACAVCFATSDPTQFRLRRAWSIFGSEPGFSGLFASDLDLDGRIDLIASSSISYNSKRHDWYQARILDSEFEVTWSSLYHEEGWGVLATGIAYGVPAVVTANWYGVKVFTGPTKALLREFAVPTFEVVAAHLADLDSDGFEELVFCDPYDLFVYDLRTATEEDVRLGFGCSGLDSGQLDEDPPLELVLAGNPVGGFVLDGATLDLEWADTDGFGAIALAVDVDDDGLDEIVASDFEGDLLRALDPRAGSVLWQVLDAHPTVFVAAQLDADPTPEIVSVDQSMLVASYEAEDGQPHSTFPIPFSGIGLAVGEFDGQAPAEIVVAGLSDELVAFDSTSLEMVADARPWDGLVADIGFGDVDADGAVDLALASESVVFSHLVERVVVLQPSPGAPARYAPPVSQAYLAALAVAQLDQDPALEICVVDRLTPLVSCFDGSDSSIQFELPLPSLGSIFFLGAGQVDSDAEEELLVSAYGSRLLALDTPGGQVLWEATMPPGSGGEVYGLRIANFDSDADLEIAVAPGAFREFGGSGQILLLHLASGALEAGPHPRYLNSFDVYQPDTGAAAALIVPIDDSLVVMDPVSGAIGAPLVVLDDPIHAVSACDLTRDGTIDFVTAFTWELRVYDGIDGSEIWRSPPLSVPGRGDTLFARDFDRDSVPEIVALTLAGVAWYDSPLIPLFRDGFESGTPDEWSSVVP